MRFLKVMAVVVVCVLSLSVFLYAGQNKFGVQERQQISFDNPVRVGGTLLPSGNYQVIHTMEGENHVMLFKQMGVKTPAEARVTCHLVPLAHKAGDTQKIYTISANNERVLSKLVFRGDTAQHEF